MRLREQVYGITKLIHTDEQVLLVIQSEINAYLDGQKTAEEAAKQIQSRLSLIWQNNMAVTHTSGSDESLPLVFTLDQDSKSQCYSRDHSHTVRLSHRSPILLRYAPASQNRLCH